MASLLRSRSSRSARTRFGVLLLGALVGLGILRARGAESGEASARADVAPCAPGATDCPEAADVGPGAPEPTVIAASEVCLSSGYLCAGLSGEEEVRIARWNGDTGRLRIRVPRPPDLEPSTARALQEAAARGLRAWHGRPFPMRVDLSDRPGPHDFVVTWTRRLGERRLGRTITRWTMRNGRADLEVTELTLVTRSPREPGRPVAAPQLELAAAHEMGHALGLPHSDDPRDLMFPQNTATRPTARDYITMSSLYELENGAVVRVLR